MIKADELKHDNIISSLENGNFYASTGPMIDELYVEDGKVHITCSKAKNIVMYTGNRRKEIKRSVDDEGVTSAEFNLYNVYEYFRIEVRDFCGNKAFTRAYFVDTLEGK